jgi:hypothetical protein
MNKLLILVLVAALGMSCTKDENEPSAIQSLEKKVTTNRHPHEGDLDNPLSQCWENSRGVYVTLEELNFCKMIVQADLSMGRISLGDARLLIETLEKKYSNYLTDNSRGVRECSEEMIKDLKIYSQGDEVAEDRLKQRSRHGFSCLIKEAGKLVEYNDELLRNALSSNYNKSKEMCGDDVNCGVWSGRFPFILKSGPAICNSLFEFQKDMFAEENHEEESYKSLQRDIAFKLLYQKNESELDLCEYFDIETGRVNTFRQLSEPLVFEYIDTDIEYTKEVFSKICTEEMYLEINKQFKQYSEGGVAMKDSRLEELLVQEGMEECINMNRFELARKHELERFETIRVRRNLNE